MRLTVSNAACFFTRKLNAIYLRIIGQYIYNLRLGSLSCTAASPRLKKLRGPRRYGERSSTSLYWGICPCRVYGAIKLLVRGENCDVIFTVIYLKKYKNTKHFIVDRPNNLTNQCKNSSLVSSQLQSHTVTPITMSLGLIEITGDSDRTLQICFSTAMTSKASVISMSDVERFSVFISLSLLCDRSLCADVT